MSTGLVSPCATGCSFRRTAARSAADGVRGTLAVVGEVRDGDVRATVVVVVAGERGAVDDDSSGLALLLHAPRTTTAASTVTMRIRIAARLRGGFVYYPSPCATWCSFPTVVPTYRSTRSAAARPSRPHACRASRNSRRGPRSAGPK